MLLIRVVSFFFLCTSLLITSHLVHAAPTIDELDDIFAFRGLVYEQTDSDGSGGNPSIKENATIYEGIFLLQRRVNDNNAVTANFTGDLVTAASYDDARSKAETVSGATGYNPGRFNIEVGWKHRTDNRLSLYANTSYGQEYAYRTTGYAFGLAKSLAEEATVISANIQIFDDVVRLIRYDGSKENDQARDTVSVNLGITQSLSPISVLNASWSHTEQNGFLATSFNSVLVGDEREFERAPDSRIRDTLSLRYKRAIEHNSWQGGVSYYQDEWDIQSMVGEFRFFYNPKGKAYKLEPSYRYYHQSGADFFAPYFEASQAYQSSDSDLGDFDGHSVGLSASFLADSWFTEHKANYDLGFNYYKRSDNLNYFWLTLGWSFPL